jgi:arginine N-succinyltransferase
MFVVREVRRDDLDAVTELAGFLEKAGYSDSINLPNDRKILEKQIDISVRSFTDASLPKSEAVYMFVLEDIHQKLVLGTSLILGKHGTVDEPHTYLSVIQKKHVDKELKIEKAHTLLRFEYDTDGPSEIGGLILHPDYRGLPLSLGKHLSYARFMYIALNPDRFEKNIVAELLPVFNETGSSDLWEAFGRRFTDLDYKTADKLSRTDRDFIKNLFPQEDIYTCLFDEKARAVIGQAGPTSSAVKHMLEKIGFAYLDMVDPFDGGPHYGAKTKEITLIKRKKKIQLSTTRLVSNGKLALVGFQGSKGFACFFIHHHVDGKEIELTEEAVEWMKRSGANLDDLHLINFV